MDQNIHNRHKEILWDLLANPAENGQSYRATLERLAEDNPQSGLLQVMYARTLETADIQKACAYFSPKALHKIMHDPDGLLPVSRERINETLTDARVTRPENYFNIGQVTEAVAEPVEQLNDAPVAEEESLIIQEAATPVEITALNGEDAAALDAPPALPPHTEENNYQAPVQDYIAPVTPGSYYEPSIAASVSPVEPTVSTKETQTTGILREDSNEPVTEQAPPPVEEQLHDATEPAKPEEPNTEFVEPAQVINQWHQPAGSMDDDDDPFDDPWDFSKLEATQETTVSSYGLLSGPVTETIEDRGTGVQTAVQPEQGLEPVGSVIPAPEVTHVPVQEDKTETYDHSLSGYDQAAVEPAIGSPDKEENSVVSSFDNYRPENVFHHAGDIEDEVFDEIVSIDEISVETLGNKFAEEAETDEIPAAEPKAEEIATQQKYIDDETERLIYGNIAATDYLTFDKKLDELRSGIKSPGAAETSAELPQEEKAEHTDTDIKPVIDARAEATPVEQPGANNRPVAAVEKDVVSKYNDDTLPYSFMWWLDKTRKEHAGTTQPYAEATQTVLTEVHFRKEFNPSHETLAKKQVPDELQQQYYANIFSLTSVSSIGDVEPPQIAFDPNKKEDVIIERFIQTDPHIKPLSADKLDNENKAKKSSEDQDVMVTETLARIYGDQMLYHKAIATYKKLILKIPEKKLYFAAQIEQLEKKIN